MPSRGAAYVLAVLVGALAAAVQTSAGASPPAPTAATDLKTNFVRNALGIDAPSLHLTWASGLDPAASYVTAAEAQTALRVVLLQLRGSSNASVLFDSGRVLSSDPAFLLEVANAPRPLGPRDGGNVLGLPTVSLASDTRYQWQVQVWTANASAPSPLAATEFTTGLLRASDWSTRHIGGSVQTNRARFEFDVAATPALGRVSVFVAACQFYELYLDGERVVDASVANSGTGARILDMAWTQFSVGRLYSVYDLAPPAAGRHALGLMIGQGFCAQYTAMVQIHLHAAADDHIVQTITTSSAWQATQSPVLADSVYYGETYDARLEEPGWNRVGFKPGSNWHPAPEMAAPANMTLSAQTMPPIREMTPLAPANVTEISPGRFVADFGAEFAGYVHLRNLTNLAAGTNITLNHAEALLHPPFGPANGSVWAGNLFWAWPRDYYVASSSPVQEYKPRFTYHGFRYVEISAEPPLAPGSLTAAHIVGIPIRTAAGVALNMTFGDPLVQRIHENSFRTEAAALMGIPAGCAGRGERQGWTGDASFAAESENVDFDAAAFHQNYLIQLTQAQCPDGSIGNGVPGACGQDMDPSWSSVIPNVAWVMFSYAKALGALQRFLPSLDSYMTWLRASVTSTGLSNVFCQWGDWNAAFPGREVIGKPYTDKTCLLTDSHITAAGSVVHGFAQASQIYAALGQTDKAAAAAAEHAALQKEFHAAFYDPIAGAYGDGTTTAQGLAIWLGVVPAAELPRVVEHMVGQLEGFDWRMIGMGFIGVRYVFEALAQVNRTDAALRMLRTTAYPSYGSEIMDEYEPATALWESFDVSTMNQWIAESSRDHHYQASINTALRKYMVTTDASAWRFLRIRPEAALLPAEEFAEVFLHASLDLDVRHGHLHVAWAFPQGQRVGPGALPATPVPGTRCAVFPQFPVPAGGLVSQFKWMELSCPQGEHVTDVAYARWGKPVDWNKAPWRCFGPQPPPKGQCEVDVSKTIAASCMGKASCIVNATASAYDNANPCHLPPASANAYPPTGYQLAVRLTCSGGGAAHADAASAKAEAESGPAASCADPAVFVINATVPAGSDAEIHVPLLRGEQATIVCTAAGAAVWSSGAFVPGSAAGVRSARSDGRFVALTTTSGVFSFKVV